MDETNVTQTTNTPSVREDPTPAPTPATVASVPMLTSDSWDLLANEQSYKQMVLSALNSNTLPQVFDPIYKKLIMTISDTVYHKMRVEQNWYDLGSTHTPNGYPGILREIAMMRRKGQNFPGDNDPRFTTLGTYDVINDDIDVRYHAAQFRWMYGYTLYDEELRRFSNGGPATIGQLMEMKAINAASARNMFMDSLRKKAMSILATQVSQFLGTGIDISSPDLTEADAKTWLGIIDALIFTLWKGTNLYNGLGTYMQTPRDRLQVIIPYTYWNNVVRKAFPDTFHQEYFENILPQNMVRIDTMGNDQMMQTSGDATTPVVPTFNSKGMNLLNWTSDSDMQSNTKVQCLIMDKFALGFEDNLDEVLTAPKDIEKLATPVRAHYWTKAYVTDMVASVAVGV